MTRISYPFKLIFLQFVSWYFCYHKNALHPSNPSSKNGCCNIITLHSFSAIRISNYFNFIHKVYSPLKLYIHEEALLTMYHPSPETLKNENLKRIKTKS